MHESDEVPVVVLCQGVRSWLAAPESNTSLYSPGAWPEQAVRNLTRKMGLRRGERTIQLRLVLPSDVQEQLDGYRARKQSSEQRFAAWMAESQALQAELIDLAARLLILGVRQKATAAYLDLRPQRLHSLLKARAKSSGPRSLVHRRDSAVLQSAE
jgi:hypothetical protein